MGVRLVNKKCYATLGQVGNVDSINITLGKAGRKRWLGKKPKVRGVVKNPIDHPHGGGEGRSPIGRPKPVTKQRRVVNIFYVHAVKKLFKTILYKDATFF